jgi:hypothetical protein
MGLSDGLSEEEGWAESEVSGRKGYVEEKYLAR